MIIRVWAPTAHDVQLDLRDERLPMVRADGGWWIIDTPRALPGVDYAFVLDGAEPPLPDPRSSSQPYGVHGRSRIVDHSASAWTDANWSAPALDSAIIYEMHVGTFTAAGTFEAAIDRLSHLKNLGVTHVELMPVAEFSGDRGWGYDGVDIFAPHHAYGGPDGLKRLVDACHASGLAVLLDVVYNHFGPSGNYLSRFGHYLTHRYATPWGDAINFNERGSDEVRRLFCDNALMWLRDYHFDGLRIDAVHAIVDLSAIHFLEQLASEVALLEKERGRRLVLIAESDLNDPKLVRATELGGYGLNAQWSDDFHHALHTALTAERAGYYADFGSIADLAKAFRQAWVYDGRYSNYRGRRHGRSPAGLSGHRFLGYAQTHDQIGNRAKGDRSSHLMSTGRLKIAAALILTSSFVPMLFQGEEWGASTPFLYFTGHEEAELALAVSEGRKREFAAFGWAPDEIPDPQAIETFERSKLNWDELAREPHGEILVWHRDLIRLRARYPELCDGRMDLVGVSFDETAPWLKLTRGRVTVACNLSAAEQSLTIESGASCRIAMASDPRIAVRESRVDLPPDSVAILVL
ncbi:MAG: maltooligosyltrehalose trehalohydrolase [Candidatus Binataceae bacterium]|nr:maltooligosyltrehalose trehalohydrolase [Candidatus Binataceae bacterium]